MKIKTKITLLLLCSILAGGHSQAQNEQRPSAKHVVLIGCDGLGAYAIEKAEMPNLKKLMASGAHSLHARTVLPSSSAVNWASMLMGAGPTLHGFTECCGEKPEIQPVITTKNGLFPSLFTIIRDQRPRATTAAIYSWGGIGFIIEKPIIDFVVPTKDKEEVTADSAAIIIRDQKPLFTFVHFSEPDYVGHREGHNTPAYYEELKKVDARVGRILAAIQEAGIADETIVIFTADHGGIDKGHGGKTLEEIQIPWVIAGPGVVKGKVIEDTIITYDTGATIAWILGLDMPQSWRGLPVKAAF